MDRRGLGLALCAGAAAAYSTAGYFTRLIPLDVWTILFWRGLFAGGFVAACFVWQEGRGAAGGIRAIGWPGLLATACSALATVLFINAFRLTSVADVVIIFATAPFLTAAIARVWFGTRENGATLAASAAALAGVAVMMGGASMQGHLAGDLLAVGMTVLMATMMVIIRQFRQTPMLPAASASAFLCALLALPLAAPLSVTWDEMGQLLLFGVTQFGLGLLLLTLGTRLISATESALVNTLEVPLAALWVWLAFSEVPSWSTLAGGAMVIAAVLGHIVLSEATTSPLPLRRCNSASRPFASPKLARERGYFDSDRTRARH
jgi:drug/metabolite transporter (DMT)-like permease